MGLKSRFFLVLFFCGISIVTVAYPSKTGEVSQQKPGWTISLGAATIVSPLFEGARSYGLSLFPSINARYKDLFFFSSRELGFNVFNQSGWRLGPIAKFNFGWQEGLKRSPFRLVGDSDALDGMGNINMAVEAGGFAKYKMKPFEFGLELRQAFFAYHGLMADATIKYSRQIKAVRVVLGPVVHYGSRSYMDTYFGINPSQAADTGLSEYEAKQGIKSYGISGTIMTTLKKRYFVVIFANYSRLTGYASNSPLVQKRGDPNQFMLGFSLAYAL